MIHDLDVILSLVERETREVSAVGIPVLTDERRHRERAHRVREQRDRERHGVARLDERAADGPRVPTESVRRRSISAAARCGESRAPGAQAKAMAALKSESWNLEKGDALLAETRSFVDAIVEDKPCEVSGEDGYAALELAERIVAEIEKRSGARPAR